MKVMDIKATWKLSLALWFVMLAVACSSPKEAGGSQSLQAYRDWEQQVQSLLKETPYILPAYAPELGPITMVFNKEAAPSEDVRFELHRSDEYGISNKLTGVGTVHDFYFMYSCSKDQEPEWSDSEIAARLMNGNDRIKPDRKVINEYTTMINQDIVEFREGDLKVYQTLSVEGQMPKDDLFQGIIDFLKKKGIAAAQVTVTQLERETVLEFQIPQIPHTDTSIHVSFAVQSLDELERYLGDLNKFSQSVS